MTITCDCKVKKNLTTNMTNNEMAKYEDFKKSSTFEIIKCYNLFFSFKNKTENIGFWIFWFLLFLIFLF